ncbi:MAG TPA: glycosyltransferase family 4 protein, partial [Bryobacteraceae bacterium]|nr:glycosyltransferase family 4 protein [Bryobacteraceae bacterium]
RTFRDQLVRVGVPTERIEIIHNAIPSGWGTSDRTSTEAVTLREKAGIPSGRKVILIVGRLSREKDHLTLLEAVHHLRSGPAPHLVIVGEGPDRLRIEARVRELRLDGHVTFTGQLDTAQPWYGIADVAVLSSLSEGSPNALLEAMATGIPVVATDVGGIPEIVTNEESALLVRPGDWRQMAAAIRRVLTEPELAFSLKERSLCLIRANHAPEARMRRLVGIYRSMLG